MKRIYTPARKRKILIVDDDQIVAHIYQEKFQRHGFKVELTDNGESVLHKLAEDKCDLVILDLCLPGINGVEVLDAIRTRFDAATLPVVAFANVYLGKLKRAAIAAGASQCVTKAEATPNIMLGIIYELLGEREAIVGDTPETASELESRQRLARGVIAHAPMVMANLRSGYQSVTRTEQPEARQAALSEMQLAIRSLVGTVNLQGFGKVAQMAGALEGLLIELYANPETITPSVARTLGQGIDTLAHLIITVDESGRDPVELPKILVVDDEAISRNTICSALRKANLASVSLDDPLAALTLLGQEHFDLIFLDVEMPGRTGLEVCASIRDMPINRATPVVFVTAHSDFGMRAQSALSGGKDFIAKPFLSVELAVKALNWLFPVNARPAVRVSSPEHGALADPSAAAELPSLSLA